MPLSVFGTHDEATLAQLKDVASRAERAALMAEAAQGDTVRVIHTLRPLIVVMAGENEFDPYKD